jgi:DNA-binding GntR family transcriptional regulator
MAKTTPLRLTVAAPNRGPIERAPSLVDEIAARLQADILEGRLAPGQRISAAAVSRELGVSHIPVREALRRLEAGALVESTHHQGAAVSRISIDELHEIYDLRRLIEGHVARGAAALYGEADLQARLSRRAIASCSRTRPIRRAASGMRTEPSTGRSSRLP